MSRRPSTMSEVGTEPAYEESELDDLSSEEIAVLFDQVLDQLLTPPHIKEQLKATQSREKKLATVKMHKQFIDRKHVTDTNVWGDKETSLLISIQKAKNLDIDTLTKLKVNLSYADKDYMTAFISNGGINVLLRALEQRSGKNPLSELDVAILFEIMSCCKVVMNNSTGMDGFAATKDAIEIIARSLRFDYKFYALLILEILSVCCYYSENSAAMVVHGLRQLAKAKRQVAFGVLTDALVQQDIEIKVAVMVLINSMIMGCGDVNAHSLLRSDLNSQLFNEKLDSTIAVVEKELLMLPEEPTLVSPKLELSIGNSAQFNKTITTDSKKQTLTNQISRNGSIANSASLSPKTMIRRKSLTSLYGPNAVDERKVDLMVENLMSRSSESAVDFDSTSRDIGDFSKKGSSMRSASALAALDGDESPSNSEKHSSFPPGDPYMGTMSGVLLVAKNSQADPRTLKTIMQGNLMGGNTGKRIKRRWCELDGMTLRWCNSEKRGPFEFKNEKISMNAVVEIRPYSNDAQVLQECSYAFEVETAERVYAFGSDNESDKDNWVTALFISRDSSMMNSGSYKVNFRELTAQDVHKFAKSLKKQREVYNSITVEDHKYHIATNGLDTSDLAAVSGFLRSEALATGMSSKLLAVLQELLLIPPGMEGAWDAITTGLRVLREKGFESDDIFSSEPLLFMYNSKVANSGSSYLQLSKLALALMEKRAEVKNLKSRIDELETTIDPTKTLKAPSIDGHDAVGSLDRRLSLAKSLKHSDLVQALRAAGVSSSTTTSVEVGTETTKVACMENSAQTDPVQLSVATSGTPAVASATPVIPSKFAKFDKMRKMLPEGAVRQKMAMEGITEQEIDDYFSGKIVEPSAAPAAAAPAEVVPSKFAKFDKMRKMLPEGAVRQKMAMDGISEQEIDDYFSGKIVEPSAVPAAAAPVESKFSKFDKMRKMLPEGAVRQKMAMDGISEQEIDDYFIGTTSGGAATPATAPVVAAQEDKMAKFEKMKKMLPEGAVRQKMAMDGIAEQEINKFFGVAEPVGDNVKEKGDSKKKSFFPSGLIPKLPKMGLAGAKKAPEKAVAQKAVEPPPPGMTAKPVIKPEKKMKGLFWNKMKAAEVTGTIWDKMDEYQLNSSDLSLIDEWFASKPVAKLIKAETSTKLDAVSAKSEKKASVLDGKRAQNVLIVMGKLRMEPEAIMRMVIELNPTVFNQEMMNMIAPIMPNDEELNNVKQYKEEDLDRPSKLIFHLNRIPRLAQRIEAHELSFTWSANANLSFSQLGVLQCACEELDRSDKSMRKLFSIILAVGNYLNGDTTRGQAYGVKLDILEKLSNLKATEQTKGSMLNFLGIVVENTAPELMRLSDDWIAVWAVSELSFKQITSEINMLETQVNRMNQEFIRIKDTKENVGMDGKLETKQGTATNPLYNRLDGLLNAAKPRLVILKDQLKLVEGMIEKTMAKYGEALKNTLAEDDPCNHFFTVIGSFARAYRKAIDENTQKRILQEKAAQRAARAALKESEKSNKTKVESKKRVTISLEGSLASSSGSVKRNGRNSQRQSHREEDIFKKFHDAQGLSSTAAAEDFKQKMHQRMSSRSDKNREQLLRLEERIELEENE